MSNLPVGTVTFLFTDIEGSTQLLHRLSDSYAEVLEQHRQLLREAFALHNGYEVDTYGDTVFVAFQGAGDAVAAAVAAQRTLHQHQWPEDAPVSVRMGLHTGEPQRIQSGYVGLDVHRAARIMAAGHGGQVLLSLATQELVRDELPHGVTLQDMGEHRLNDLTRTEHLYQLVISSLPADFAPLKTLSIQPNNLPLQMTSFVGREAQLHEVRQLLSNTRLLTLTGAGGTGKTRLALQVSAKLLEDYPDGVWLVELAPMTDSGMVPQAIASALSVREEPGQSMTQTLSNYLASRKLLLILDNCEHLLQAAAQLAETLLRSCPELRVLATSREGLGIAGEQIYRVPSLSVPDMISLPPTQSLMSGGLSQYAESLNQYEAVRLFIERAVAAAPSFAVTNRNAPAVAQVCYHLDGIPLAIELAAARVKMLSVEQINGRLEDRFRLLTGGSRTALPRQQTLRALIDWSHDLLDEAERALLRRLSVFAGGWTLEAAEAVCAADSIEEWQVLELLGRLVDKSLVLCEEQSGQARYRLLQTVRQYAAGRLLESGEREAVRETHAAYLLHLAEDGEARRAREYVQGMMWIAQMEREQDNLRAAFMWSRASARGAETGLRLASALYWFWIVPGHWKEGQQRASGALAHPGAGDFPEARAKALYMLGTLNCYLGQHQAARAHLEAALSFYEARGNSGRIASALNMLANLSIACEEPDEARSFCERCLAICRETGNKRLIGAPIFNLGKAALMQGDYATARARFEEAFQIDLAQAQETRVIEPITPATIRRAEMTALQGDLVTARAYYEKAIESNISPRFGGIRADIAPAMTGLGDVLRLQGETERATSLYEQSMALLRETDNKRDLINAIHGTGYVALARGDLEKAKRLFKENLQQRRQLGSKRDLIGSLVGFAHLAAAHGRMLPAACLLGAVQGLLEALGLGLEPIVRVDCDRALAVVRAASDDEAFAAAWDAGRAMTLEQAVEYALQETADA